MRFNLVRRGPTTANLMGMAMRVPLPSRRWRWAAFVSGSSTFMLLVLISGMFQWSPLNCRHEDVDINSGRIRRTGYLLYVCVSDVTDESWVSRFVQQPLGPPAWHRVNTFSPGVHYSPHYRYHGAISQMRFLEVLDSVVPFELHAKEKVAGKLLEEWQKGSYFEADAYLQRVSNSVSARSDSKAKQITAADLP